MIPQQNSSDELEQAIDLPAEHYFMQRGLDNFKRSIFKVNTDLEVDYIIIQ